MMQTPAIVLNCADLGMDHLSRPLANDRVYSEQFLADLLGVHVQTLRVARRKDAAEGTIGRRVPAWTEVSDHRLGYLGWAIKAWQAGRTVGASSASEVSAAAY